MADEEDAHNRTWLKKVVICSFVVIGVGVVAAVVFIVLNETTDVLGGGAETEKVSDSGGGGCINASETFCTGDTSVCVSQELKSKVCDPSQCTKVCSKPPLDFFTFGPAAGDTDVPRVDDGYTPRISLDPPLQYFNGSYDSFFVITNGGISFVQGVSTYTPSDFPFPTPNQPPLVAAYWADVEISRKLAGDKSKTDAGNITYRVINDATGNDVNIAAAARQIQNHLNPTNFKAQRMILATWDKTRFFNPNEIGKKRVCTFQLALVTDYGSNISYAITNYKRLEWTTGTASGGNATTGLHIPGKGGGPALAGFDAGDNVYFFKLPGSKTNDALHLTQVGNTDTPGLWIFRITKPEVPGAWGAWAAWSDCTKPAANQQDSLGTQNRTRLCDSPPPQNGGASCPGEAVEINDKCVYDPYRSCILGPCLNGSTCIPKVNASGSYIPGYTCDCAPCFTGQNCSVDVLAEVNIAVESNKPSDLTDPLTVLGFKDSSKFNVTDPKELQEFIEILNALENKTGQAPQCVDVTDAIAEVVAEPDASSDTDATTSDTPDTAWITYLAAGLGLLLLLSACALIAFLVAARRKKKDNEGRIAASDEDVDQDDQQSQSEAAHGSGGSSGGVLTDVGIAAGVMSTQQAPSSRGTSMSRQGRKQSRKSGKSTGSDRKASDASRSSRSSMSSTGSNTRAGRRSSKV